MPRETADHGADGPAALARARHVQHAAVRGQATQVAYEDSCLLDQLRAAGAIPDSMYDAGIWLRERWFDAGLVRRCTMGSGGGGGSEPTDSQIWNAKCYDDTLRALPAHSWTLIAVCCEDSPRDMLDMRRALQALADHRGIR